MKYTADEARQLKAYGEIPDNGRKRLRILEWWIVTIENTDAADNMEEDNCAFEFDQI